MPYHLLVIGVPADRFHQIGTASASVSAQIADVQRLIEQSGVKYVMHSAGTTLGAFSFVSDWLSLVARLFSFSPHFLAV